MDPRPTVHALAAWISPDGQFQWTKQVLFDEDQAAMLDKLDWVVIRDPFEQEDANHWVQVQRSLREYGGRDRRRQKWKW